jgi:hypothetical protein
VTSFTVSEELADPFAARWQRTWRGGSAGRDRGMNNILKETDSSPGCVTPEAPRLWAGRGTGKPCQFCSKAIRADEVQYDLEVVADAAGTSNASRGQVLSFHFNCYDPWLARRQEAG